MHDECSTGNTFILHSNTLFLFILDWRNWVTVSGDVFVLGSLINRHTCAQ